MSIDRLPPQSVEAEQSVLGALLIDKDAVTEVAELLSPADFYRQHHGMIYAADPEIHWVFHCHSPEVWRRAPALDLPCTPAGVSYGSPAMTAAVAQVLRRHKQRPMLFATLGHEDGLFACGATAEAAGTRLVAALAQARS